MSKILSIADYKRTQELSGFHDMLEIFKAICAHRERINKQTEYNCVFVNKDGFIRFEKMMGFYERYRIPKQSEEPLLVAHNDDAFAEYKPNEYYEYRFDNKNSVKDLMIFKQI